MSSRPTSSRPTTVGKTICSGISNGAIQVDHAIFQDNVASVLYARRLFNNGLTGSAIDIINVGPANIVNGRTRTIEELESLDFAAIIVHEMSTYLMPINMAYGSAGNQDNDGDNGYVDFPPDKSMTYYVGRGPLGDFISSYYVPRIGPWFGYGNTNGAFSSHQNSLGQFVQSNTIPFQLNSAESIIVPRLAELWNIRKTNDTRVTVPSILTTHYIFVRQARSNGDNPAYVRNLFRDVYVRIIQEPNVSSQNNLTNIQFDTSSDKISGLYNAILTHRVPQASRGGTNNVTVLSNRKLDWKVHPYVFFYTAGNGGLGTKSQQVPTFYRAIIPIPAGGTGATGMNRTNTAYSTSGCYCNCPTGTVSTWSGVDLTNITGGFTGDGLTTYVSFSLYSQREPNGHKTNEISWLGCAYTTYEDLSTPNSRYAHLENGYILLIVEAVSTENTRVVNYDASLDQVHVSYNPLPTEGGIQNGKVSGYLGQFAEIVSSIYLAYTGSYRPAEDFISTSQTCSAGFCDDSPTVFDYSTRESPLVSVLVLASSLYGARIYPVPPC